MVRYALLAFALSLSCLELWAADFEPGFQSGLDRSSDTRSDSGSESGLDETLTPVLRDSMSDLATTEPSLPSPTYYVVTLDDSKRFFNDKELVSKKVRPIYNLIKRFNELKPYERFEAFTGLAPQQVEWVLTDVEHQKYSAIESAGTSATRTIYLKILSHTDIRFSIQWNRKIGEDTFFNNPFDFGAMKNPAVIFFVKSTQAVAAVPPKLTPAKWASTQLARFPEIFCVENPKLVLKHLEIIDLAAE